MQQRAGEQHCGERIQRREHRDGRVGAAGCCTRVGQVREHVERAERRDYDGIRPCWAPAGRRPAGDEDRQHANRPHSPRQHGGRPVRLARLAEENEERAEAQRGADAETGPAREAPGARIRGGGGRAGDRKQHPARLQCGHLVAAADREGDRQHRRQRSERGDGRHLAYGEPAVKAREAEELDDAGRGAQRDHLDAWQLRRGERPHRRGERQSDGLRAEQDDHHWEAPCGHAAEEVGGAPGDAGAEGQGQRNHQRPVSRPPRPGSRVEAVQWRLLLRRRAGASWVIAEARAGVGLPPKWPTATAAATSGSNARQEKTSMKHLPANSSAWMVIELVSMNCIADQPSSWPSPNRSSRSGPCARMPIASIKLGTKAWMEIGSASRWHSQPCRSIAASMPHGGGVRLEVGTGRARRNAGPPRRWIGVSTANATGLEGVFAWPTRR